MSLNHISILWMNAEPDLVEAIARKLCKRHGLEIYGDEAVTKDFLDTHWRSFECEARDAISMVREYEANQRAKTPEAKAAGKPHKPTSDIKP